MRSEPTGVPGALTEVVSVRFGDVELRRVQAYAVICKTTPAAVIREACGFYLSHQVGTPGYHQAVDAYCERARRVAAALGPEGTP